MKAVVTELREGEAAVLAMDGTVRIVTDDGYEPGQVLEIEVAEVSDEHSAGVGLGMSVRGYLIPAAAFAGMILTAGGVAAGVALPVSTVTMDLSCKIEYQLNFFDKVVSVSVADEAERPLEESLHEQILGRNLTTAVERTLDVLAETGVIMDEQESLEATVSSRFEKEKALEEMLTDKITHWNKAREAFGNKGVELTFRDAAGKTHMAEPETSKKKKKSSSARTGQPEDTPGSEAEQKGKSKAPDSEAESKEKPKASEQEEGSKAKTDTSGSKSKSKTKAGAQTAGGGTDPQQSDAGAPAGEAGVQAAGSGADPQQSGAGAPAGEAGTQAAAGDSAAIQQAAAGGGADAQQAGPGVPADTQTAGTEGGGAAPQSGTGAPAGEAGAPAAGTVP